MEHDGITIDPAICHGKLVIEGTRMTKSCNTPEFDTLLAMVLLDFHHISVGIMKPLITQSGAADNRKDLPS